MSTTVRNLLDAAILYLSDTDKAADYTTACLPMATQIVSELMTKGIGVEHFFYDTECPGEAGTAAATDTYIPVKLPDDITDGDQVISVGMSYYPPDWVFRIKTIDGVRYLLAPPCYSGPVRIEYAPAVPDFTSFTDAIPLSDRAVRGVAAYGLAALLSLDTDQSLTTYFEQKYAEAKRDWQARNPTVARHIRTVYAC